MSKKNTPYILVTIILLLLFPNSALAVNIVVDPGHGGSDPGALGINGLREKDVNLDIALQLRDRLEQKGYSVFMTRTTDKYYSLSERVAMANAQKGDLFVSIHANWFSSPSANGTLVLYYDDAYPQSNYPASEEMKALTASSRSLAEKVLRSVVNDVKTSNQGIVPSAVYVVRMGTMPSILVETAFLSNASDAAMLADSAKRTEFAIAIANGIEAYLPPYFADIAGHWAFESIVRLKESGIVTGMDQRFMPDASLTRAEFMTMLDRIFHFGDSVKSGGDVTAAGTSVKHADLSFADLSAAHWAYATINNAVALGYVEGFPDGTVRPDAPITRAEVAGLLDKVIAGAKKSEGNLHPQEDVKALEAGNKAGTGSADAAAGQGADPAAIASSAGSDNRIAAPDAGASGSADPAESNGSAGSAGNTDAAPANGSDGSTGTQGSNPLQAYSDVPSDAWYADGLLRLKELGIINGKEPGIFGPQLPTSRAEMATMLDRYLLIN